MLICLSQFGIENSPLLKKKYSSDHMTDKNNKHLLLNWVYYNFIQFYCFFKVFSMSTRLIIPISGM